MTTPTKQQIADGRISSLRILLGRIQVDVGTPATVAALISDALAADSRAAMRQWARLDGPLAEERPASQQEVKLENMRIEATNKPRDISRELIISLCEQHGFGYVMDVVADEWHRRDPVGAPALEMTRVSANHDYPRHPGIGTPLDLEHLFDTLQATRPLPSSATISIVVRAAAKHIKNLCPPPGPYHPNFAALLNLAETLAANSAPTFARQPTDCGHERAEIKCPDCGIDLIGTLKQPTEKATTESHLCKHDDGDCHQDDPCEGCPVYRKQENPLGRDP